MGEDNAGGGGWGGIYIFLGWPKRPTHQPAMLPTSEKGTYLSKGRATHYLPGVTPMASVICEKYIMTIINLNKKRFLHRKGSPLSPQFHLAQASPLQSEFPTWVRGLFSLPPLGHLRGMLGAAVLPDPPPVSGAHHKYFPNRSTAGPTPHIWSSGHSYCHPPSSGD